MPFRLSRSFSKLFNMIRRAVRYLFLLSVFLLLSYQLSAQPNKKYWIYFKDKKPLSTSSVLAKGNESYQEELKHLQSRAFIRRAKILPTEEILDAADLPLYEPYIKQIQKMGGILAVQSRWLNAASCYLTTDQVTAISRLNFVDKIEPVVVFRGKKLILQDFPHTEIVQKHSGFDYGSSLAQLQMINVPPLHTVGVTGKGILIGMLDSGFRWREHEALQSRNVIAEHDFIFNDAITANQEGDSPSQDGHGTLTFSVVGGYKPGNLYGPAFDADFILGKTEYIPTETQQEEDNWVAGLEWMEGFGVDVVSSSVGYNDFDPQGLNDYDYTWEKGSFDGRTTVSARAAARAARLGVVVCTSMGNEGQGNDTVGTLLTPADADSIISVGAVTFSGYSAAFSSSGPTNDGRIKPDLVAPGVKIFCASVPGPNTYVRKDGTSLSTPLTAGAAALVLSARPELTPIQVRNALRATADSVDVLQHPNRPNNFIGWGLVNAFAAALQFGPIFSNIPYVVFENDRSVISTCALSKFGICTDSVKLYLAAGSDNIFTSIPMLLDSFMFFPTSGRYRVMLPQQVLGTPMRFYIEAYDSAANFYRSPAPITGNVWKFYHGDTNVKLPQNLPTTITLRQNYPNPFNALTWIEYELPKRDHVTLKVYNVLGQLVKTLFDDVQEAGNNISRPPVLFDAGDLPSGIYFYRLSTSSSTATRKMLLIR
ncbi:MAG: S8/S53 family peptidase [Bacteroidota bacterium]|nr:S8/S53 family peptidase [Bacteroidota bacterium]